VERVDIRMLGTFAVAVDGAALPASAWSQRRAADLVKLLALAPGHRLARDVVLESLWPHLEPQAAASSLHKAAHFARRALGARDGLVLAGGAVALAPGAEVTTDVARFEAGDDAAYAGDLLPEDLYEAWTHAPRERLRELALGRLREAGRWDDVIALDPADEEAHRELMRAAALRGDRSGVVRWFGHLRTELARLGTQPSPASLRLLHELSRGPAVRAPLGDQAPIAGRAGEVAAALARLEAAEAGSGGVLVLSGDERSGKTRLAEAVLLAGEERRMHTLRASAGDGPDVLAAAVAALRAGRPDLVDAGADAEPPPAPRPARAAGGADAEPPHRPRPARPGAADAEPPHAPLLRAARERGCVVLLDELHLASDAAVDGLLALAADAAGARLLVIAAWRPAEARGRLHDVARTLAERRLSATVALDPLAADPLPATRYATSADGARIAFQLAGAGPADVVVVPGFVSNVEHGWDMPAARRMYERLSARARLVLWDKRGTGLSDPVAAVPTMDERIEDLTAVLDAAEVGRAMLFGVSEGVPLALLFAARHPERVDGLVLLAGAARFMGDADHPRGWKPEIARRLTDELYEHWGTGSLLSVFAPGRAADPVSREVFGRFQRAGASPAMGRAMAEAMFTIDVRDALPRIAAPTLVLHREGDRMVDASGARHVAENVPDAVYVELPGDDHFPFLGSPDDVLAEVDAFLDEVAVRRGAAAARG
jgi:pimeloyl-ACP methyl ester carboxylesterase/DNA-binding SARP family transcriptional activator